MVGVLEDLRSSRRGATSRTQTIAASTEMFGAEVRYSGVSVGFQLGALVAGAPTPFVATALPAVAARGTRTA